MRAVTKASSFSGSQSGLSGGEVLESGDVIAVNGDELEPLPIPGWLPEAGDGVVADRLEFDQLDVGVDALERPHQIDDLVCTRTIDGWVWGDVGGVIGQK